MPNILLSYGTNCKDNKSSLSIMDLVSLYELIIAPDEHNLVTTTQNLRSVLKYSQERYRYMKTSLPFFSCSHFDPPLRGIQNFVRAEGLVIDLDMKAPLDQELIRKFKEDERIALGYISPSNMGIKLVFVLDEPVRDAQVYRALYLKFSSDFAMQYHLADCLDQKNCDVSRISFICHDSQAWFNSDAIPLTINHWISEDSISVPMDTPDEMVAEKQNIPETAYKKILELLDTRPKTVKAVVPLMPEISQIMDIISEELDIYEIRVDHVESIQYGAKLRLAKDVQKAEINVYYGKQGYRVVTSPRKGTDHQLNEVARFVLQSLLDKY
ncbi:MAG: hypothetical protein LC107_08220 [Chitinophagales bacterium]|nr:hypothetical protein [Chitinophagales bacterium]